MSARTRLAIVGAGLVGRRHADAIAARPEIELVGVVDSAEEARRFAERRGLPSFGSLEELFAEGHPDGVVLATPTPLHVEQGLACVANDCPVLVEKPLATTASEARRLVDAGAAAGVALLVGHHRRHNPLVRQARELVANGEIGEVRTVQGTCWFYKPDAYFDAAPWRKAKGAGPISVNLVHDVDLMRHLCGEIVEIRADIAPSSRGYENEETAAALLRFANGALGTLSVSDSVASPWSWELTAREYPVYPTTTQSCLQIGGSRGSLSVPDVTLWRHVGAPDWWSPIVQTSAPRPILDPLIEQIRHFAAVVRGEEASLVPAEEGWRTMRVIEAIATSAASGERVRLEG